MRLLFPALLFCSHAAVSAAGGYFRFPAVHGDTVVFTAEGDLWKVPVTGGAAQRLTTHPGSETRAAISPDGRSVAFAAEYEGPEEVYVMPIDGGLPKRLTWNTAQPSFVGWTAAGKVACATRRYASLPNDQLIVIDPATGQRQPVPLWQASEGTWNGGGQIVFTRLPFQGSSTKRYQGGTAQNLWRFDGSSEAQPLTTDFPGTSKNPLWWDGRIVFLTDRDRVMNLWSMTPDGKDLRQHTKHAEYDAKSASLHGSRVVYQHGADLRRHDLNTGADEVMQISLPTDADQQREKWVKDPLAYVTAAHLSPDGDRVVLTVRGQVFVVPVKAGRLVEAARKPGVRCRDARFFPDGKSLLTISDESGELEFWRISASGGGEAQRLTQDGKVFRFEGIPSPDGKWLAHHDKDWKLWLTDLTTGQTRHLAEGRSDRADDLAWSADSGWLAWVQEGDNSMKRIWVTSVSDGRKFPVTSDRTESWSPAWAPDGKWLWFLSDRALRSVVESPWGPRQPEPFFDQVTVVCALSLVPGQRWPFQEKDELSGEPDKVKEPEKKDGKSADEGERKEAVKPEPVIIAADGLAARLFQVPVKPGNYESLSATGKHLLWLNRQTGHNPEKHLQRLEIGNDDPKPKTLAENVKGYELSGNGQKLLIRKGEQMYVTTVTGDAPAKPDEGKVDLSGWTFAIQPREEWRQMFTDSWRLMRDYFYDRKMHGLDWPAVLKKYAPLAERVADRGDLSDLVSEMVGELSALHIYVRHGDHREGPDNIATSELGAQLEPDPEGWRVARIHETDPDFPDALSPLVRPGVEIRNGDIITALNGIPAAGLPDPGPLLRRQAGRQVLLSVKSGAGDRRAIVRPLSYEAAGDLRYDEWEYSRRMKVEEAGKGSIGYVHLRAMTEENIAEWARGYFPVFNRQGLIIDVRHNRGGNIDSWILNRLLRRAWFYWQRRTGDPYWNMQFAFRGHLCVLCDERTASDGEAFSEGFRRLGLGKVIGTRTWGGEIWLSMSNLLVDKGIASAAETGVYGPEGAWLIEGHGVDPDIVVDNLPHATWNGGDAQLDAAVRHLQEMIAADPRRVPPAPPYPDKTK